MRTLLRTLLPALALFHACAALATHDAQWPAVPSRLQLDTPYGQLHVSASDYVYESYLMLDDQRIEPEVKGLLNIPYAFSAANFHVALVSVDTCSKNCPVHYTWIMLNETGYTATPPFGSCTDQIRVDTTPEGFTMLTPSVEHDDKLDKYLYDGKVVTVDTVPAPKS